MMLFVMIVRPVIRMKVGQRCPHRAGDARVECKGGSLGTDEPYRYCCGSLGTDEPYRCCGGSLGTDEPYRYCGGSLGTDEPYRYCSAEALKWMRGPHAGPLF
jgi:hypothetical protein